MKSILSILFFTIVTSACNNKDGKDTVDIADSTNKANIDTAINNKMVTIDEATAAFMVKAANGGMAEVDLAGLAQQKAISPRVKDFASLLISDHSSLIGQLKMLALAKNVVLPEAPAEDKLEAKTKLSMKSGKNFDKAFIEIMVKDHQEAIDLFEKAINDVKDPEVSAFADKSLPRLRVHLNDAKTIRGEL
jgi:putative membrane protein